MFHRKSILTKSRFWRENSNYEFSRFSSKVHFWTKIGLLPQCVEVEVHHLLKLLIHVLVVFNAHWDDSSGLNANEGTIFGTN